MARARRGAAAAATVAKPLLGCCITLTGRFDGGLSQKGLEELILTLGGTVSKSVTKVTTHVVSSEVDYIANANKVAAGKNKDLPVVAATWLTECEEQKMLVDAEEHSWDAASKAAAGPNGNANGSAKANGAAANGSKKRAAKADVDDEDEDEDDEPQPKKAKGTKGAAKTATDTKAPKANGKVKPNGKAKVKDEPEEPEEEKIVAEGQFIKKKDAAIPVDEFCPLTSYQVHVDPDTGMIYDASLNQSNSSHNNNKFYRVQVLRETKSSTYKTWTRWGRVGEAGQNAILGNGDLPDAIKNFEKKFRDKSGLPWDKRSEDPKPGKYAFVERSYNPDSDDDDDDDDAAVTTKKEDADEDGEKFAPPECTLEKPVKELMQLIFNQDFFQATMSALNYDANKLPLGKLSKATITRGFQQLKDLAALLDDPSLAQSKWNMSAPAATEHLSNTYYSVIPHAFGRNRPPIIRQNDLLKKEIELLESLSDMKDAADIMKIDRKTADTVHALDRQFQGLGMEEMTTLDSTSTEFSYLEKYLNESRGATHNVQYKVQEIFRIERHGEHDRFASSRYAKIASDRRLLWHGSRCTNFGGILSQGLRIAPPEAPVSGYMFGKGIYLADMSSKSAGYCASYVSNGEALLLLCEAELGDPMQKLSQASYTAGDDAKKNGMVSTWGMGGTGPSKWMDAGVVHDDLKGVKMPDPKSKAGPTSAGSTGLYYNEYICYDVAQVKLRYLFRVKM